jgi:hypothetical protein
MVRDIDRAHALSILQELRSLDGPSRKVDVEIALLAGFEKFDGEKVVWLHPETRKESKVPRYTSWISHAFNFSMDLLPDNVGACTWGDSGGNAQIEPGPPFSASNPAIALCICTLFVALSSNAFRQDEGYADT